MIAFNLSLYIPGARVQKIPTVMDAMWCIFEVTAKGMQCLVKRP